MSEQIRKACLEVTFPFFLHVGCAFLTYEHYEDSQQAIAMFHNKLKLPNSSNPVQIRPADSRVMGSDSKVSPAS